MKRKVAGVLMTSVMLAALMTGCGNGGGTSDTAAPAADSGASGGETTGEKQNVPLTLWGAEEDQALLQTLIDSFKEEYGDVANFDISLGVESESTAKDTILTDAEAAADVFAFASDQLADLVNAGALQSIDEMDAALQNYAGKGVADIKSANSEVSVQSATMNDTLYAFPMTADNGYFLYYDSSVVSPEQAQSWDSLLEAADAAGKRVGFTMSSGWYNASFFYSAGFTTALNEDGSTSMDWNGEADYTGVEVAQAMINIASDPAFMAVADGDSSNQIASGQLCAAVSGTWDAQAAQTAFGDGYAATKLPTFTIAGEQLQQSAVIGCKLVGVNAHSENAGWAALLADWITNEDAQQARFDARQIGPSNNTVLASDEVNSNTALAALSEQNEFGVIQSAGQNYWDPAATFGEMIAQGSLNADDTAGIQEALDTLVEGVTAPIQ